MSPIALLVLTGIIGPMLNDRIAHPDRYQTKPIPAMRIGPWDIEPDYIPLFRRPPREKQPSK